MLITSFRTFAQEIRSAGLLPSFKTASDALGNAMVESCRSHTDRMTQPEKWKTRIELVNALFEYIEVFTNRKRRRSSLGYQTPTDFDLALTNQLLLA